MEARSDPAIIESMSLIGFAGSEQDAMTAATIITVLSPLKG
jgi:hypothetical protein